MHLICFLCTVYKITCKFNLMNVSCFCVFDSHTFSNCVKTTASTQALSGTNGCIIPQIQQKQMSRDVYINSRNSSAVIPLYRLTSGLYGSRCQTKVSLRQVVPLAAHLWNTSMACKRSSSLFEWTNFPKKFQIFQNGSLSLW